MEDNSAIDLCPKDEEGDDDDFDDSINSGSD